MGDGVSAEVSRWRPHFKVCCIASVDEARLAVAHGARAVGLVSHMPSGPGVIDEAVIAQVAAALPREIATFLLTSRTTTAEIVAQHERCRVTTLQFVDRVEPRVHVELRRELPGVQLVQVIHVGGRESYDEALEAAPRVDALLLDSGNQSLVVKELGGTGRTHDWSVSAAIVEDSPVPVFLAGGLNASNVADAVRIVAPHGLDVCSGVRTNGVLDLVKIRAFVGALRGPKD